MKQDRQCTYNVILRHFCSGKAVTITYFFLCVCVCVCERERECGGWVGVGACARVVLILQHAMRRHIVISAASLAPPYISKLSHKRQDLKKVIDHKMCVVIFYTLLLETFIILRTIRRDIVINVKTSSCKTLVVLG